MTATAAAAIDAPPASLLSRSFRRLLACYRDAGGQPAATHVAARALLAPLDQIVAALPDSGTLLDAGAGHGLLSLLALRAHPRLRAHAVDHDAKKISILRRTALAWDRDAASRLAVHVAALADAIDALPFDHALFADVLYLLPANEAFRVVDRLANHIRPGGMIVIHTADDAPGWKSRVFQAEEFVAIKILRITRGTGVFRHSPQEFALRLQNHGFRVDVTPIHGYPVAHVLIVAKKR